MKMHVGGAWVDAAETIDVLNPFDGSVVDTVPRATMDDVQTALATAQKAAEAGGGDDRLRALRDPAPRLGADGRARGRSCRRSSPWKRASRSAEADIEVARATEIIALSAEEAKRLGGEVLPLDGAPGVRDKVGFTLRVPCGVVVGISPFNFPLHLVCHKAGPAFAAGNAAIIKPATDTPLSGLKIVELLVDAGAPPEAVQCLTGSGGEIGDALCEDPRVRKITFTGSRDVGEHICKVAGLKKVTMELGSNAPFVVMPDADPEKVAKAAAMSGYSNAGQVCISTQRVLAHADIYGDFVDAFKAETESINTGNPLHADSKMGPMIRQSDAERVHGWVDEALTGGATLVTGGERDGQVMQPTVVEGVTAGDAHLPRRGVRPGGRHHARWKTSTRRSSWPTTPTTA